MYKTVKHHYSGSFIGYIMIYGFVYRNGPTNVRKSGNGVLVSCRAPYIRPGGGRGLTVLVVSEPRFRRFWKTY